MLITFLKSNFDKSIDISDSQPLNNCNIFSRELVFISPKFTLNKPLQPKNRASKFLTLEKLNRDKSIDFKEEQY